MVEQRIFSYYDTHGRDLILVSGGCPEGADHFCEEVAETYGIPILIFYPDKQDTPDTGNKRRDYGILAYRRNTEIAKISTNLLALTSKKSKGTKHTISEFKKFHHGQELIIL